MGSTIPAEGKPRLSYLLSKMTNFNLTKDILPETIFKELKSLNKLSNDQFTMLARILVSHLLEPNAVSKFTSQLEEFGMEQGMTAKALKLLVKPLLNVINVCLKKNFSSDKLSEDLCSLGLEQSKSDIIAQQHTENKASLSAAALSHTLTVNQLIDMEWKFGVTAGSSEVNRVSHSFLQLKLVINTGNQIENIYMELSLPQFYTFMHEMEKAKASLEFLS